VVFVDVMDVVMRVDTLCVMMVVVNSLHIKNIHVGDICTALVIQSHVVLAHVVFVKSLIMRLYHVR
tara:strand:+ start:305 stop:502 length:198 start_codon:yes stop_codon:yes gene_type:complete